MIVTHLGNGGPLVQQQNVLAEFAGLENVILVGDFNFKPDSEQYRLTTQTYIDAWLAADTAEVNGSGWDPQDRIDHVFVSPGIHVNSARYLVGPASDHPALVVDISIP